MIRIKKKDKSLEKWLVILAFTLGMINGLLYVFILPPWQHYDEPNHFEYVWLLASRNQIPKPGDYDPKKNRQIIDSMIAHDFYQDFPQPEIDPSGDVKLEGYTQLDERPVYYLLSALPVYLLRSQPVEFQLYAARLVSFALFLVTLIAAWGIAVELSPPGHPLRWMVPLTVALLPAFVDLMTAVNNDVGSVAVFSLFLWGAVRLIQRGFNIVDLIWTLAAAGLCVFTKVTAFPAVALVPVALLLSFTRGRWRSVIWGLIAVAGLFVLLAAFNWGDASLWGRISAQATPDRTSTNDIPLGSQAFDLHVPEGNIQEQPGNLVQVIRLSDGQKLGGKTYTVGGWVWASTPIKANLPAINAFGNTPGSSKGFYQQAEIGTTPKFFAYQAEMPAEAWRAWISLTPFLDPQQEPVTVYYDGITLVEGALPVSEVPQFHDLQGKRGIWGGQPFINMVRNASAESSGLRLRPWVDQLGARLLPDKGKNYPSIILYALFDWDGAGRLNKVVLPVIFNGIWARFAWGHIWLPAEWVYSLIGILCLVGLAGFVITAWRCGRKFPWPAAFFLGLVLVVIWGMTFTRSMNYYTTFAGIYYPSARHGYPAIIPLVILLVTGWAEIGFGISNRLHLPKSIFPVLYIAAWLALDIYSLYVITQYYYPIVT